MIDYDKNTTHPDATDRNTSKLSKYQYREHTYNWHMIRNDTRDIEKLDPDYKNPYNITKITHPYPKRANAKQRQQIDNDNNIILKQDYDILANLREISHTLWNSQFIKIPSPDTENKTITQIDAPNTNNNNDIINSKQYPQTYPDQPASSRLNQEYPQEEEHPTYTYNNNKQPPIIMTGQSQQHNTNRRQTLKYGETRHLQHQNINYNWQLLELKSLQESIKAITNKTYHPNFKHITYPYPPDAREGERHIINNDNSKIIDHNCAILIELKKYKDLLVTQQKSQEHSKSRSPSKSTSPEQTTSFFNTRSFSDDDTEPQATTSSCASIYTQQYASDTEEETQITPDNKRQKIIQESEYSPTKTLNFTPTPNTNKKCENDTKHITENNATTTAVTAKTSTTMPLQSDRAQLECTKVACWFQPPWTNVNDINNH